MHSLYYIENNRQTDITPIVGSISWTSHVDQLGQSLDFDIAYNDDRFFPINPINLGGLIVLRNNNEILRAIVLSETRSGRGSIAYTAMDYMFYLNKSQAVYQFNGLAASKSIAKILNDFAIPIGNITPMNKSIDKIYKETVSDIIKDIILQAEQETGTKYHMEMREGKLYIEPQNVLEVVPVFKIASNLPDQLGIDYISKPQRKRSIEEMRNSIQVVAGDDVIATVKNDALIKQYGILQKIENVDETDIAQAQNIAKNLLKELGKIFEQNSVEMPGDDQVRAGKIIAIVEPVTGMNGKYLIESVSHSLANGIHKMKLALEVI